MVGISADDLIEIHELLSSKSRDLISKKGKKYCGVEQAKGDTLASRTAPYKMGIGKHPGEYSLGRVIEKIYRLKSMMEQNLEDDQESIEDSVLDIQNDVIYAYTLYRLSRGSTPQQLIDSFKFVDGKAFATLPKSKGVPCPSDYVMSKMHVEDTSDEKELDFI